MVYNLNMVRPLAVWTTGAPVPEAERMRGSFFDMIRAGVGDGFSGEFLPVDARVVDEYPDPAEVSGIIVSGSAAHLRTQDSWMLRGMRALREAHAMQVPILGICFGHQMLGEALGGRVGANPRGREIGTPSLSFHAADPLFDDLHAEATVVMTHLDSVLELPQGAQVVASTDKEPFAALRFSDTTWGVQFHPEMDAEIVGYYLEERRASISREGLDVDAILRERSDSPYGSRLLTRFGRFCETGTFEG